MRWNLLLYYLGINARGKQNQERHEGEDTHFTNHRNPTQDAENFKKTTESEQAKQKIKVRDFEFSRKYLNIFQTGLSSSYFLNVIGVSDANANIRL